MGRGKNIITIMNRVQVVGANGAGVAYSRGSVIPWKKRIDEGFYKQKGGGWFARGFTGFSGATRGKNLERENRRLRKERDQKRKQKGGGWTDSFARGMFGYSGVTRGKKLGKKERRQKEEELRNYEKEMRPPRRKQKGGGFYISPEWGQKGGGVGMSPGSWLPTPPRNQRGGSWFDGLSKGMFGIERKRGKKKKPAVIHSAATVRYPQKGGSGKFGMKGFFENPFHVRERVKNKGKKQKGGVLGIGKIAKWYGGKSKKEQGEIDAWTAKNL